jgi:hypothetical protein
VDHVEDRAKFDAALERPLPGRPTSSDTGSVALHQETDSLRAMGAWASQVQGG